MVGIAAPRGPRVIPMATTFGMKLAGYMTTLVVLGLAAAPLAAAEDPADDAQKTAYAILMEAAADADGARAKACGTATPFASCADVEARMTDAGYAFAKALMTGTRTADDAACGHVGDADGDGCVALPPASGDLCDLLLGGGTGPYNPYGCEDVFGGGGVLAAPPWAKLACIAAGVIIVAGSGWTGVGAAAGGAFMVACLDAVDN